MIIGNIMIGIIYFILNFILSAGIGWGFIFLKPDVKLIRVMAWTKPPVIALLLYFILLSGG